MKLTVTIKEACALSSIGKTKLYSLIAQNKIATVTIGRRRLVKVASLMALLNAE